MKRTYLFLIILLLFVVWSCSSQKSNSYPCGIALSDFEYNRLMETAQIQSETVYNSDTLISVYEQINDSLRSSLPDSLEFEIFLNTLDSEHFSILVLAPKNNELLKSISCNFFNIKLQGNAPLQRVIFCYSYNDMDENAESPLEFALKNK